MGWKFMKVFLKLNFLLISRALARLVVETFHHRANIFIIAFFMGDGS